MVTHLQSHGVNVGAESNERVDLRDGE
jgi:hypothetical protein